MKKQIFVCTLAILSTLLCACEDAKPVETNADVTTTAAPVETTAVIETTTATTTTAPAETTTTTTTAPIETTAVTTTAPILSTEPQTVTAQTYITPRLDWITSLANGYRHDYAKPTATFTYTLPAGWGSDEQSFSPYDYVTLDRLL